MKTFFPAFRSSLLGRLAGAALALGVSISSGYAQSSSAWTATANGSWSTATNWSGSIVPGNTSAGVLATSDTGTFNSATGVTVAIDAGRTIDGITFGSAAGAYTIGSATGPALYLSSGGVISAIGANTETIAGPLIIYGTNATGTFTGSLASTAATLRFSGTISGSSTVAGGTTVLTLTGTGIGTNAAGGSNFLTGVISNGTNTTLSIVKNGTGAWGLSNTGNTFSGGVTLASGTLNLNSAGALGTGALTIGAGTTINNLSGATFTVSNVNTQAWNGNYSFTGTNSMGFGTGAVTLGANTVVTVVANTLTEGGNIGGGSFTLGKAGSGTLILNGNNTYNGLTTVTAGALTLAGTNTGTGGVTLTAGTLNINSAGALGSGTLTVTAGTLNSSGTAGVTLSTNNAVNLNGNFTFTGTNALNLGTGAVTLGGTTIIATVNGSGALTLGGNIGVTSASLVKAGSGTLILNGVNSYTGSTTIQSGVLSFGSASSIAGSGANVADNYTATAAFQYAFGQADLARLVSGSRGTVALSADNSNNLDFSAVGLGNLSLGASGGTFNYNGILTPNGTTYRLGGGGGTLNYNSAITSGSLIVGGNGTGGWVTLSSADTSSAGITVTGGYGSTVAGANGSSILQTNITTSNNPFGASGSSILLDNGGLGLGTAGAGLNPGDFATAAGYNVTFSGQDSIQLKAGSGQATFDANSLTRANNGILLITPSTTTNLGSSEFAYVDTNAPTVTNGMVGPYYIDGTTQTFMTYDPGFGFTDASTVSSFTGGPTSIVSTASNGTVSGYGNVVVNAVKFTNTNTSNSVSFGGTNDVLTITSGGLIFSGSQGISNTAGIINFGSAEAVIGMFGSTFSPSSTTLGTGGLTTYGTGSQNWSTSSITGGITVAGGQLNIENGNGNYTFITSNSLTVDKGGTLGFGTNARPAQFASLAGDGTVSDFISGFGGANNLTIDGFTGTGTTTFSGIIQDFTASNYTLSFTKYGSTTQVLSGYNNYAGTTTVNGGTLLLDFSGANAPANNIINNVSNASGLSLGGGALAVVGAANGVSSQQFNGLTLTAGSSAISLAASGGGSVPTLALGGSGTFTARSTGATLNVTDAGIGDVSIPQTAILTNGIWTASSTAPVAFATLNGSTWATVSGGKIVALGSYSTNDFSSTANNVDITGNDTPTAFSVNSLRFSAAGASLALTGSNTIGTGGILVTSATGTTGASISGGTTLAAGTGKEVVIIDNGQLTVSSVIADSTSGASALTLSGSGTTTLLGANTFTGNAYVNSGTVIVGNAASFGTSAGTLVLNGGTLQSNTALSLNAKAISLNNNSTIGGSNNLTFTGTFTNSNHSNILTVNNTGNTTLAGTVILTNAFSGGTTNNNLMLAGSGNVTMSGTVVNGSEAASLTYAGTGTLTLANTTNTYTGPTRVSSGTISVSTMGLSGAASSIGSSSSSAANLVINGSTFQYTGGTTTTDHLFSIGGSGGTIDASGSGAITFSNPGAIGFDATPGTRTLTLTGANTGNNTLGSTVSDFLTIYATSVNKTGAGTWNLTGANTYSGGTTVSSGILSLTGSSALSSTQALTTTTSTFTLNVTNTAGLALGETVSGSGIVAGSYITGIGANTVTLSSTMTSSTSSSITFGSYSSLGTGPTTVNSGATLALSGSALQYSSGGVTLNGTGASGQNGALVNTAGNNVVGGAVTLGSSSTISVDAGSLALTSASAITGSGSNLTLTGTAGTTGSITSVIGTGAGSLTKSGAGTWALSNANTYTGGTTVSAGKLLVSNTTGSATGSGAFQLNSGATLSGNGIISGTTNTINGTVLAGFDTGATNTTGSLTVKSSGTTTFSGAGMNLAFNLSTTPGTGTELNVGNSAVAFGTGMTLTLNLMGGTSALSNDYILFAGTGTSQYSGLVTSGGHITNFNIVLTGTTLGQNNSDLYGGSYLYLNGNNIDVVLAVPEPGTWAMMLGGLALLVIYQRRRSKRLDV